jgi:hypothetical protein
VRDKEGEKMEIEKGREKESEKIEIERGRENIRQGEKKR